MKIVRFIKKGLHFLKHYLLRDPEFVFRYAAAYIQNEYKARALFYSKEQVLEKIKNGASYIRLGDGEIALMKMRSIHFQDADFGLRKCLKQLIQEYTINSPYILAIPERYVNRDNRELKKINLFHCWLPFKVAFRQFFNKNVLYADAHAFYIKAFFEESIVPLLRDKYLIIITNKKSIDSQRDNVHTYVSKNTVWIESPATNSFEQYEHIKSQVELQTEALLSQRIPKNHIVVIVSSGPMGKVLAHTLSHNAIQCLDMGHGFEKLYQNDMSLEQSLT